MSENNKSNPSGKSIDPADFDKTQLDINIQKLDEEDLEKTQILGRKPEASPSRPEPGQTQVLKAPPPQLKKPKQAFKTSKDGDGEVSKYKSLFAPLLLAPILIFQILLLIDALSQASPVKAMLIAVLGVSLFSTLLCLIRKSSLKPALDLSVTITSLFLAYVTYKYGSLDTQVLSLFHSSWSVLANFYFAYIIAYISAYFLFSDLLSKSLRALLLLLIVYFKFSLFENLIFAFLKYKTIWSFEDNLDSVLLAKLPFYLKPEPFFIYFTLSLLLIVALYKLMKANREWWIPAFTFATCVSIVILGQVLLLKNAYPSLLSLLSFQKDKVGVANLTLPNHLLVQVLTNNYSKLKYNDTLLQNKMGVAIASDNSTDSQGTRKLNLIYRNEEGRVYPMLKKKDLQILDQSNSVDNVKFSSQNNHQPRQLLFLYSPLSSSNPQLEVLHAAFKEFSAYLNTKEKLYVASLSEKSQPLPLSKVNFKQTDTAEFSNPVLMPVIDKAEKKLKFSQSDSLIVLLLNPESNFSAEDLAKFANSVKRTKSKLVVICSSTPCTPSVKDFSNQVDFASFESVSPQDLQGSLVAAYAAAFPDYQVSYSFKGGGLDFQFTAPDASTPLNASDAIHVQLNSPLPAGGKLQLLLNDQILSEKTFGSDVQIDLPLKVSVLPRGKNTYKLQLLDLQGNQVEKSVALSVPDFKSMQFIRPFAGDVLSGSTNLEVFFRDLSQAVTKVEYFLDNQKLGELVSEPYLFTLNPSTLPQVSGNKVLKAVATLADGNILSDEILVEFTNNNANFSAKILSPSLGEYLNLLSEIEVEVSSPLSDPAEKVEFYADGILLGSASQAPYKYLWDNSALQPGKHFVQARVFGKQGIVSDAVVVNIGSGTLNVNTQDNVNTLSPDYFEWVIDASKTMNANLDGVKKLDAIKQALVKHLPNISSSSQHAFRWMGSQSPSSHQNCKDSALFSSFKPLDVSKIQNQFSSLQAKGIAPLSYTLEKIRADLTSASGSKVVALFTDGYENCSGDPVVELERWKKSNLGVKLYILGLDLEGSRDEIELKRIASLVAGEYVAINKPADLDNAIEQMSQITYSVYDYKGALVLQKPVASQATQLRTGEYKVQINLEPVLTLDKVLLMNGVQKKLQLQKNASNQWILGELEAVQ